MAIDDDEHDRPTSDLERRLLRLARRKGLVGSEEESGGTEERSLAELVHSRVLDRETLGELVLELAESELTAHLAGRVDQESPLEQAVAEPAASPSEALRSLQRFEEPELVGRGGMGVVYRAWDAQLRRHVALKFLSSDRPEMVRRFAREAQAQARVEHDNVCRIYEVGEALGRPYIVMRYLKGTPLEEAARQMNLEQKLEVLRQVAEGVHAAHRTGLVHRDLKPANIIVEEVEDGRLHPYVLDFGLAMLHDAESLTLTGEVAGTPSFMAPEQASGDSGSVDRRTDVYALGATLYALLAGHPPFQGPSALELLMRIVDEEPASLRGRDPNIPIDVETVVLQCLEKEPARRYDSARALAEDLRRYLEGEAILARPPSLGYRLGKLVRRNRTASVVVAVALILLVGVGTWGIRERWLAQQQAAAAQRLGQEVKEIEAIMRFARMSPMHATTRERELVRERMHAIESQLDELGRAGYGPAHYALGRGALSLGEAESARAHLKLAWESGYRPPAAAYALGEALASLYRRELAAARRTRDPEAREARILSLRRELRDPAVELLRQGAGAHSDAVEYVQAWLALLEDRWDDALAAAAQARARLPWLYEAVALEGEIHRARGGALTARGEYQQAAAAFERADRSYLDAIDMARSDVDSYLSRGGLWLDVVSLRLETGQDPEPSVDQVLADGGRALAVEPGNARALCMQARAMVLLGEHLHGRGDDPRAHLDHALDLIEQARAAAPTLAEALHIQGTAHTVLGRHAMDAGADPGPHFEAAVAAFSEAVGRDEGHASIWRSLGNVHYYMGQYDTRHGEDPTGNFERFLECYRQAVELEPGVSGDHSNMGAVFNELATRAQYRGEDPTELCRAAIAELERAVEINPEYAKAWTNMANASATLGNWRLDHGLDPVADLERAIDAADRAIAANPEIHLAYLNKGKALLHLADLAIRRGEQPVQNLEAAESTYARALQVNPRDSLTFIHLGTVHLYAAQHEAGHGRDPRSAFGQAIEAFERSAELNPDWVYPPYNVGYAHVELARWKLEAGIDPTTDLRRAERAFATSQALNPDFVAVFLESSEQHIVEAAWLVTQGHSPVASLAAAEQAIELSLAGGADPQRAQMQKAGALLVQARWLDSRGEDPGGALTAALAELESIGAETQRLPIVNVMTGRVCSELAAWRIERGDPPADALEIGMTAADELLAWAPAHAEALALKGTFELLSAQREPDAERARELIVAAAGHLERALATNPRLARRYGYRLAETRTPPPM